MISSALDARVAALEAKVAALQGQAGGGEQLSPNYLTTTPSGLVGASFSGGVSIPEQANAIPVPSLSFNFLNRNAPGGISQYVLGYHITGDWLSLVTQSDASDFAAINMESIPGGAAGDSVVLIEAKDSSGAFTSLTGVTSAGASSFLQLLSPLQLQLAFGTASFGGNNTNSVFFQVAHTLGRSPQLWGAFTDAATGEFWIADDPTNTTAAQIGLVANAAAAFGAGVTYDVYWFAIG